MYAMFGPELGRRHDHTILRNDNWEAIFDDMFVIDGIRYYVNAYSTYNIRPCLQAPIP